MNPNFIESHREVFHEAARLGAEWIVRGQETDRQSELFGSFVLFYQKRTGLLGRTNVWTTAVGVKALLSFYRRSGEEKYLRAAERAGEFIKNLQVMGEGERNRGAFHESNPATESFYSGWSDIRDAVTGAWGLLALYNELKKQEYLDRVVLFLDWLLREGLEERTGLPAYWVSLEGSHQKSSIIRYVDVALAGLIWQLSSFVREPRYVRFAQHLGDQFIERFQKPDGSLIFSIDMKTGQKVEWSELPPHANRHLFQDDFATIGLLGAFRLSGDRRYLDAAIRFSRWLMGHQAVDGSFHGPLYFSGDVPKPVEAPPVYPGAAEAGTSLAHQGSYYRIPVEHGDNEIRIEHYADASATSIMGFTDLYPFVKDSRYLAFAALAGKYLLGVQEKENRNPHAHGGLHDAFSGPLELLDPGRGTRLIHIKLTSYATIAWLKLEGVAQIPYYSVHHWPVRGEAGAT